MEFMALIWKRMEDVSKVWCYWYALFRSRRKKDRQNNLNQDIKSELKMTMMVKSEKKRRTQLWRGQFPDPPDDREQKLAGCSNEPLPKLKESVHNSETESSL